MWTETRLKFLAGAPIENGLGEAGAFDDPDWPRYVRTTDIAGPRSLRNDVFVSLPPEVAAKATLRRGDLLMTAAGATIGKSYLHESDARACYAGYLVRFRGGAHVDSRFIAYWTESSEYWNQIRAGRVISTIENFSAGRYRNLRLRIPGLGDQRRIADFLDIETARIDALVERKRRMIELLDERNNALFAASLESRGFKWSQLLDQPAADCRVPSGWQVAHLSVVLDQLTNGYVGPTRDLIVDDGVRYIQSLHIKQGKIDFDRRPFYVPAEWHAERPRIHLRPSDVLIVQTGDIGQIAVVPEDFGAASCHALQIARVRRDILSGEYLGAYLRSPFGKQSLLSRATGALHPHLEGGIRDIPVVLPPLSVQDEVVREIEDRSATLDATVAMLLRQIDLLVERRQALITAAVTGELDVAEAA